MCRELCSRRAYLGKLLLGRDIDIENVAAYEQLSPFFNANHFFLVR